MYLIPDLVRDNVGASLAAFVALLLIVVLFDMLRTILSDCRESLTGAWFVFKLRRNPLFRTTSVNYWMDQIDPQALSSLPVGNHSVYVASRGAILICSVYKNGWECLGVEQVPSMTMVTAYKDFSGAPARRSFVRHSRGTYPVLGEVAEWASSTPGVSHQVTFVPPVGGMYG